MTQTQDGAAPVGPDRVPRRLNQVEEAVRDGHETVSAIADRLYGPFDERIRRMIEATVRAHLRYLQDRRRLSRPVEIDG